MEQIIRQDREGWTYGVTKCGELFVGSVYDFAGKNTWYMKDTPENRKRAEAYWKSGSFAKEIKRRK